MESTQGLIIDLSNEYIFAYVQRVSPENSTIASSEVNTIYHHKGIPVNTILFITVHSIVDARYYTLFSTLNIPFESEQKQKFQVTKSPPVLHRHKNTA